MPKPKPQAPLVYTKNPTPKAPFQRRPHLAQWPFKSHEGLAQLKDQLNKEKN